MSKKRKEPLPDPVDILAVFAAAWYWAVLKELTRAPRKPAR